MCDILCVKVRRLNRTAEPPKNESIGTLVPSLGEKSSRRNPGQPSRLLLLLLLRKLLVCVHRDARSGPAWNFTSREFEAFAALRQTRRSVHNDMPVYNKWSVGQVAHKQQLSQARSGLQGKCRRAVLNSISLWYRYIHTYTHTHTYIHTTRPHWHTHPFTRTHERLYIVCWLRANADVSRQTGFWLSVLSKTVNKKTAGEVKCIAPRKSNLTI